MTDNREVSDGAPSTKSTVSMRLWLGLGLLGIVTYLATLIATLPAGLLVGDEPDIAGVDSITGTVWTGQANLAGGHSVIWHLSPISSLLSLRLSVHWVLTGTGTDLQGDALMSSDAVTLSDVTGIVGWPLVKAISPAIDANCDIGARIDLSTIQLGAGEQSLVGTARSGPGTCSLEDSGVTRSFSVPALVATGTTDETGSHTVLNELNVPAKRWADMTLMPNRRVGFTWYEPALSLLSATPPSGPVSLEFQF